MQKKTLLVVSVLVTFMLLACLGMQEMDPTNLKGTHAKARFINVTYTLAWQDYQRFASLENLKPEAVELLKTKRVVLLALHKPVFDMNGGEEDVGIQALSAVAFNLFLDKLMGLEMGWYVATEQDQTPTEIMAAARTINVTAKNDVLRRAIIEAGLAEGDTQTTATLSPAVTGLLIELLRVGIHAVRAMLTQRGLDEAQMTAAWQASWDAVKTLDPNSLVVLQ